jgi:hypothetical protein
MKYVVILGLFVTTQAYAQISLNLKVNLQGASDTNGNMRTDLRDYTTNLIPTNDPYGTSQSMNSAVMNATGNDRVVDWVLVELRNPSNPSQIIEQKAGVLRKSGAVVNANNTANFSLSSPSGSYFVSVRHRNHLRITSAAPVALSSTLATLDFTLGGSYGLNSQVLIGGKYMLLAGDVNGDGSIRYTGASNDRDYILSRIGGVVPTNVVNGYYPEDVNMNAAVMYTGFNNDRDIILAQIGGTIPTNVIFEQLPPPYSSPTLSRDVKNLRIINPQNTSVQVVWDIPSDTAGLTGYQVSVNNAAAVNVTTNSYSATGFTAQTQYDQPLHNVKVKAVYSSGTQPAYTAPLNFRTAYTWSISATNTSFQVSARAEESPNKITVYWVGSGNANVFRKTKSQSTWTSLGSQAMPYVDTNVTVGTYYEYRIQTSGKEGYVASGIKIPAEVYRGKILILVESNLYNQLTVELAVLAQDLRADGWIPTIQSVSSTQTVAQVKTLIQNQYNSDSTNMKSVFIIGHLAVPMSGNIDPDGHGARPFAADACYGDMTSSCTSSSTNIPSALELQVGRVDLSNLPAFQTSQGLSELDLTRNYLDKLSEFKNKVFTPENRGIYVDKFQWSGVSQYPLGATGIRSISANVGPQNLYVPYWYGVNYTDHINNQSYLWAYQGDGSSNEGNSNISTDIYASSSFQMKSIFNMSFGSFFGHWDQSNNFLRAPIAAGGLASMWCGVPFCWFQHMGMGDNIGYSMKISQNNSFGTAVYTPEIGGWQGDFGSIHLALMGDPTLRQNYVAPPTNLQISNIGGNARFTWSAAANDDILGYRVYEITSSGVSEITSSIVTSTSFDSSIAYSQTSGRTFMVRAVKLEISPSGTYYNLSLGAIWD